MPAAQPNPDPTTTAPVRLILGDQLSTDYLADCAGHRLLMVEDPDFARRRPYHAKKLVLIWSAMRHFAAERHSEGWDVDYRTGESLDTVLASLPAVSVIQPREKGIRPLLARHHATLLPDPYWWTSPSEFRAWLGDRRSPRLEEYWRHLRKRTGLLMDGKNPVGGEWNYDKQNRKPFPKGHVPVPSPVFEPDTITKEVMDTVRQLPGTVGTVDGFGFPTTRRDALALLDHFIRHKLESFGPYEDALHDRDPTGYHSLLTIPLNIGLLSPQECVDAALAALDSGAPIASVEAFVRQIAGWREYLFHLWQTFDGDWNTTNALEHHRPLPEWFWTGETPLRCVSIALKRVLENAYGHHIERLMVIGNFALLLGVSPQAVNDWFWSCYADAFEWVVTPNVVGMSQFGDGGWVASKPYISSGAYIDRMGNFCKECRFDPKTDCPFTVLYWTFLIDREAEGPLTTRMAQNYFGLARKSAEERAGWIAARARVLPMLGCD
jgi:deoxyribodipyrimidine photolyase-related protein